MIIIPMAGKSSRFAACGYVEPKYMLTAHGNSLFYHSLLSFKKYFTTEIFIFIARDFSDTIEFIKSECFRLGLVHYEIILLNEFTRGQAETVYKGLLHLAPSVSERITIFNIDTFRKNFEFPQKISCESVDGYLETFEGQGENWSYVEPLNETQQTVRRTAEKVQISRYCCTGLYYWRNSQVYKEAYKSHFSSKNVNLVNGEYYIAPMYNSIISQGADVRYTIINKNDVIFCGVPSEYESFKEAPYTYE